MEPYETWTIEALEARLEALSAQRAAIDHETRRVQAALEAKRAELAVRLRLEHLTSAELTALRRLLLEPGATSDPFGR